MMSAPPSSAMPSSAAAATVRRAIHAGYHGRGLPQRAEGFSDAAARRVRGIRYELVVIDRVAAPGSVSRKPQLALPDESG